MAWLQTDYCAREDRIGIWHNIPFLYVLKTFVLGNTAEFQFKPNCWNLVLCWNVNFHFIAKLKLYKHHGIPCQLQWRDRWNLHKLAKMRKPLFSLTYRSCSEAKRALLLRLILRSTEDRCLGCLLVKQFRPDTSLGGNRNDPNFPKVIVLHMDPGSRGRLGQATTVPDRVEIIVIAVVEGCCTNRPKIIGS